jgi:hypothetical protein
MIGTGCGEHAVTAIANAAISVTKPRGERPKAFLEVATGRGIPSGGLKNPIIRVAYDGIEERDPSSRREENSILTMVFRKPARKSRS